jgi:hypothetical protein
LAESDRDAAATAKTGDGMRGDERRREAAAPLLRALLMAVMARKLLMWMK